MTIYTSYFYMVRFMRPWEVPLSTAVWDPKWFHEFQGQDHIFIDKNGVLNGMRASMFAPDETCRDLCRGPETCATGDPATCMFLRNYRAQLDKIDGRKFVDYLHNLCPEMAKVVGISREPDFIFMLHEAPTNPCSERGTIQQWFKAAGVEIKEWTKPT